jgi:hypothetical protein
LNSTVRVTLPRWLWARAGADRFTAGAEGGDGDDGGQADRLALPSGRRFQAGLVIHEAGSPGDRGILFDEIGKFQVQVGVFGFEPFSQFAEDILDIFHVDEAPVGIEDLDKSAHVGAFEMVGQIHAQGDIGDRILAGLRAVHDLNGMLDAADSNLVNADFPGVFQSLGVRQGLQVCCRFLTHKHGY